MERYQILIDGGTTNTRIVLWDSLEEKGNIYKFPLGVKASVEKSREEYLNELKKCLELVLNKSGVFWDEIEYLGASGMITSELGIAEISHIEVPVGVEELRQGTKMIQMEQLCPKEIYLVPGVFCKERDIKKEKNVWSDMMRGEETEVMGILEELGEDKPMVIFLLGSHDKVLFIDEKRRIQYSCTSISGELLSAVTMHTILGESVGKRFATVEELDKDILYKGYIDAQKYGFGNTCFLTRIYRKNSIYSCSEAAVYLLGAVLEQDIHMLKEHTYIRQKQMEKFIIAGRGILCKGLYYLLSIVHPEYEIVELIENEKIPYAVRGLKKILK